MGSAPSPPQPPDPHETAQAQTGMNIGSAEAQAILNMVNQQTPYGNLNYTKTGDQTVTIDGKSYTIPTYTASQTYTPAGEQQLKYSLATGLNLGEAGQYLSGQIGSTLSRPIDLSNNAIDQQLYSEYGPMMERQQRLEQEQLESQLAGQGAAPGSPAYQNAQLLQHQKNTDAWNQLFMAGRGEAVGEITQQYEEPMKMAAALMGGGQPQNPQFGQTPQENIQPANYESDVANAFNAKMQAYQAQVQQQNSMMGGLFGMFGNLMTMGMGGGGGGGWFSERSMKTGPAGHGSPQKVGELHNRLPVYAFKYKGAEDQPAQLGLLAHEVEKLHPEAITRAMGKRLVDYGKAVR